MTWCLAHHGYQPGAIHKTCTWTDEPPMTTGSSRTHLDALDAWLGGGVLGVIVGGLERVPKPLLRLRPQTRATLQSREVNVLVANWS